MKSQYASELKAGQSVKEVFFLSRKTVKDKKDGGLYAIMVFTDRTGSIDAISWDGESLSGMTAGAFVFVTGNVAEYSGRLQIVVHAMNRVDDREVDAADFLPRYAGDIGKIMGEIREYAARVKEPHLRMLLDSFFEDETFVGLFASAPAAVMVHHAYLGGLAVHTLGVLKILDMMSSTYEFLNADLLFTGGILHDVGKIYEYTYKRSISLSDRGRLLGHIAIGSEMVSERVARLKGFPEDLKSRMIHMVLSHHGVLEWGSPKEPLFPEALMLHYADDIDSRMEMIRQVYAKHRGQNRQWSDYHPFLEREIYLGDDPQAQ